NDSLLDRAGVKTKFDVFPEQIVDYLALVGDTSDNIPGVPKVGPKTAAKWLNEYGTLDELIRNAGAIQGKVGESLRESYTRLELRSLLRGLTEGETPADAPAAAATLPLAADASTAPQPARNYQTVMTMEALQSWLERLQAA